MAQEIEIGSRVNFNRYSRWGKSVMEGKIIATDGEHVRMEILNDEGTAIIKVHRREILGEVNSPQEAESI